MVPAVERAMRILNAFKDSRLEYGVSELSHALDINKSTVHGIVRTLSEYRMLEQDPNTRKYRLGPSLIELGGLARTRRDVRQVARPFLGDLMRQTQETVLLGVFEDDGITIIDTMEPARELRIAAAPGQRLPYSAGSFGRAFLAWMREEEVDRLIASLGLRRFTETTITDPARYKASLEQVRQQGFAVDDSEEYLEGVWAVSAPIHDADGILAVLTVVGFTGRMEDDAKRSAIEATTRAARQISLGIGAPSEGIN
jgi:DNA-binding IclR family transcriptional regulator